MRKRRCIIVNSSNSGFSRTLGSLPRRRLSPRQTAFLAGRAIFEARREAWLAEGRDPWVRVRNGAVEGFFRSRAEAESRETVDDGVALFELLTPDEEQARWATDSGSTSSLICEPFLDTDIPERLYAADRALEARGYPGWIVGLLRVLALTGLWWNVILWNEWHLDFTDVMIGWSLNLLLLAIPVSLGVGFFLRWNAAAATAVSMIALALGILAVVWTRGRHRRQSAG